MKVKEDGVDYVGLGLIYVSFIKDNLYLLIGFEMVRWAVENFFLFFVVIGGIKDYNLKEVLVNGVRCICVVIEIVGVDNI